MRFALSSAGSIDDGFPSPNVDIFRGSYHNLEGCYILGILLWQALVSGLLLFEISFSEQFSVRHLLVPCQVQPDNLSRNLEVRTYVFYSSRQTHISLWKLEKPFCNSGSCFRTQDWPGDIYDIAAARSYYAKTFLRCCIV